MLRRGAISCVGGNTPGSPLPAGVSVQRKGQHGPKGSSRALHAPVGSADRCSRCSRLPTTAPVATTLAARTNHHRGSWCLGCRPNRSFPRFSAADVRPRCGRRVTVQLLYRSWQARNPLITDPEPSRTRLELTGNPHETGRRGGSRRRPVSVCRWSRTPRRWASPAASETLPNKSPRRPRPTKLPRRAPDRDDLSDETPS